MAAPGSDSLCRSVGECGGFVAGRRQQIVRLAQALASARKFHLQRMRLLLGFEGGRLPVGHLILQLPEQLGHLVEQEMIGALALHRRQQGPAGLGHVGETARRLGEGSRGARRTYTEKASVLGLESDRRTIERSVAEGASVAGGE